ncbi:MAG: hypothetical protein Q4D04_15825 [Clostridia bacterium]|nr:hypothetical protein [Clostridia bacterium]
MKKGSERMQTARKTTYYKGASFSATRRTDDVVRMKKAIKSMTETARKDPNLAFQRIYEGGMINKDGSIREELFR